MAIVLQYKGLIWHFLESFIQLVAFPRTDKLSLPQPSMNL